VIRSGSQLRLHRLLSRRLQSAQGFHEFAHEEFLELQLDLDLAAGLGARSVAVAFFPSLAFTALTIGPALTFAPLDRRAAFFPAFRFDTASRLGALEFGPAGTLGPFALRSPLDHTAA
jgi:hypothetical protein